MGGSPGHFALRIVEITKDDRMGRAGFHAGRNVVSRSNIRAALRCSLCPRRMQAPMAEVAFLGHTPHPGGNIGVERLFHPLGPAWIPPVEVPRVVRACCHAVAASETPLGHLSDNAGLRIHVNGILRAHLPDFITKLSTADVRREMKRGAAIVDARYSYDYTLGHIDGAISIPPRATTEARRAALSRVGQDRLVVIYCQSKGCDFSESLAELLVEEDGYTNIALYPGGWEAWSEAGAD